MFLNFALLTGKVLSPQVELVTAGIQSSRSTRVQRLMQSELNSYKLWDTKLFVGRRAKCLWKKEGFYDNCSLINSERGALKNTVVQHTLSIKTGIRSLSMVNYPDAVYDEDEADELDICYDDSIIFGDDEDDE